MKTFIIAFLFLTAAVLPILFIPLLVLTLVVGLIVSPYLAKHNIWTLNQKPGLKHS